VHVIDTNVGSAYGKNSAFATEYFKLLGQWISQGKYKPNKVKIIPGGLSGVEEGLKLLQNNKVNGEKLVYRIAETPSL